MEKHKATYHEMIDDMKEKGIEFDLISERNAIEYLRKNNYYFKLTAYRKNFERKNGSYADLDFAYLVDLATIDAHLRYLILDMCLDIEHAVRSKILDLITTDNREDGYQIVEDFRKFNPKGYNSTMEFVKKNKYSIGLNGMHAKHHDRPSIWMLLENMTFGTLCFFAEFYYERSHYKTIKPISDLLKFTKNLRNACAHNNCLILNLFKNTENIKNTPRTITEINNRYYKIDNNLLHDRKINDLLSLFYLHSKYTSKKTKAYNIKNCRKFLKRAERNKQYYEKCHELKIVYKTFCQFIDSNLRML